MGGSYIEARVLRGSPNKNRWGERGNHRHREDARQACEGGAGVYVEGLLVWLVYGGKESVEPGGVRTGKNNELEGADLGIRHKRKK